MDDRCNVRVGKFVPLESPVSRTPSRVYRRKRVAKGHSGARLGASPPCGYRAHHRLMERAEQDQHVGRSQIVFHPTLRGAFAKSDTFSTMRAGEDELDTKIILHPNSQFFEDAPSSHVGGHCFHRFNEAYGLR